MSERDRQFLRGQLATIGIFLDKKPDVPIAPTPGPPFGEVDRDFVRAALVRAGAPAADLEWLVSVCPSELDALAYRAPLANAFCAVHDGPQPTDQHGCVLCRSVDLANPPPELPTKKAP